MKIDLFDIDTINIGEKRNKDNAFLGESTFKKAKKENKKSWDLGNIKIIVPEDQNPKKYRNMLFSQRNVKGIMFSKSERDSKRIKKRDNIEDLF